MSSAGGGVTAVRFERLPEAHDLPVPERATDGSAGYDLRARLDATLELAPGARALVPTGIRLALPRGFEGQVRPRSGLALAHGLTLLNAPGTVDSDYRGEIAVILVNLGQAPATVRRGDRVAQLVIARLPEVALEQAAGLPPTARGAGGFGHTGSR